MATDISRACRSWAESNSVAFLQDSFPWREGVKGLKIGQPKSELNPSVQSIYEASLQVLEPFAVHTGGPSRISTLSKGIF